MTSSTDQRKQMDLGKIELKKIVHRYPAKKRSLHTKHQASVALILRPKLNKGSQVNEPHAAQNDSSATASLLDQLEVLMIERSVKPGDPWSGHMAFPGGKKEEYDQTSSDTAIRETFEEIGLHLKPHQLIGQISDIITRHHDNRSLMKITPWIFLLDEGATHDINLALNHEARSYFWIPLSLFEKANRQTMKWRLLKIGALSLNVPLPHYRFRSKKIWGLSLMMLDEFTHLVQSHGYQKLKFGKKIKLLFS